MSRTNAPDASSRLLDLGAQVLAQSRHERDKARRIANVTRELILRFGLNRLPPICGGTADPSKTRWWVRFVGSLGTSALWIVPSAGATCDACNRQIAEGELQYEVIAEDREMRLDGRCYRLYTEADTGDAAGK